MDPKVLAADIEIIAALMNATIMLVQNVIQIVQAAGLSTDDTAAYIGRIQTAMAQLPPAPTPEPYRYGGPTPESPAPLFVAPAAKEE